MGSCFTLLEKFEIFPSLPGIYFAFISILILRGTCIPCSFYLFIYLLQLVLLPDLLFLFFIAVELLCNVVLVSATEK